MKNENENGNKLTTIDDRDELRWRKRLQAAVRAEKAPERLRERIGKMIREK
jgi:hypothetical protein